MADGLPGLPPPGFATAPSEGVGLAGLPPPGFASQVSAEPSFYDDLPVVGGSLARGAADLIGLAESGMRNFNPMQPGGPQLMGLNINRFNEKRSPDISEYLLSGAEKLGADLEGEAQTTPGKLASGVAYYAPGALIPGGSIASRAASAGLGGLSSGAADVAGYGETGQSIAGLLGSLTPAAASTAIAKSGKAMASAADKLDLSAFGAKKTDIRKAVKRMPDILDDAGEFKNPINDAIESFKASGGGKSMEPEALLSEIASQKKDLYSQLDTALADAQAKQVGKIKPRFTLTNKFVEGRSGASEKQVREIADDVIEGVSSKLDGSLLSLQKEKQRLGQEISETAWGQDNVSQLRSSVLKRVRADLRKQIEDAYQVFTGDKENTIKKLNQELGKRENLDGLFREKLLSDQADSLTRKLVDTIKTTGGYGSLMFMGNAAGGLPAAIATPLLARAASSPTGQKAMASALRGGGRMAESMSRGGPTSNYSSLARSLAQYGARTEPQYQE